MFGRVSAVFAVALFAIEVGGAGAAVYVVRPDRSGDFPSIQAAIDAAVDGDVIELTDGIFRNTGNRDIDYLGKAITVRSQSGNPETRVLDCRGSDRDPHRGFRFVSREGNDSVLEGVTVQNGYGLSELGFSAGGAVYVQDSSPTIRSCRLLWNSARAGGGIACISGAFVTTILIEHCTIGFNTAEVGGGIHFALNGHPSVISSTLVANTATQNDGGGIYFTGGVPVPTLTIENSIIAFSAQGQSVECADFGWQVVVSCSDFYGNAGGDWIGCFADQAGVSGNLAADPLLCGAEFEDFHVDAESPCAPDHNPECGLIGAWPVACGDPTPVIDSSWGRLKTEFRVR